MGMMTRRNMIMRSRGKEAPVQHKNVKEEQVVKTEVVEETKEVEKTEPTSSLDFTKEDIETMNYMKLKSLAKKNGVEVEDRDVKDIRSDLIEKLGL